MRRLAPVLFLLLLSLAVAVPAWADDSVPPEPPLSTPVPLPVLSRAPDVVVLVHVTHYWPPNGGENCLVYLDDWCVSPTASGVPWEAVVGIAAACPMEWPIGSVVMINSRAWICLDRGDLSCDRDTGVCDVDLLTAAPIFDGIYRAEVYFPFAVYRGPYEGQP